LPIWSQSSFDQLAFPPLPAMTVKTYYEIHSKRGHLKITDDKIDVRDALNKSLIVVEVQEMALYQTDVVVRTSVYRQIEKI
jgi:hypothetical protein